MGKVGRPKKENTTGLFVRVPIRLRERLRADAEKDGRHLSWHVRTILEAHYAKQA